MRHAGLAHEGNPLRSPFQVLEGNGRCFVKVKGSVSEITREEAECVAWLLACPTKLIDLAGFIRREIPGREEEIAQLLTTEG